MDMQTPTIPKIDMTARGLTPDEVARSRKEYGENRITRQKRKGFLRQFAASFGDPVIKILLIVLAINIVFMFRNFNWFETAGIAMAVFLATFISTLSEYGSESAFLKLQEDAESILCRVKRSKGIFELPVGELVRGDLVLLQAGERIPADGVLISGKLSVDQSPLNGESKEAAKTPAANPPSTWDLSHQNQLFHGCTVASGDGIMRVVNVGDATLYGDMARQMQEETRESPLKLRLAGLARTISRLGYFAAVLVIVADLFNSIVISNGFQLPAIQAMVSNFPVLFGHLIHALTLGITVVVMAVPEGLPMMITVVLSSNMRRMLKDHVLVRKLVGIETSGNINVLFTDKTGTLTKGKLQVSHFITGSGNTLSGENISNFPGLYRLVELSCYYNCASNISGGHAIGGNATDRALLNFILPLSGSLPGNYQKRETIPFDSSRKFSASHIAGETDIFLLKGAPERILPHCRSYYDEKGEVQSFASHGRLEELWKERTQNTERVIALAAASSPISKDGPFPSLCLVGLVCIRDEIRPDARDAIRQIRQAGVHVVMVTGDNKETAAAIARRVGLLREGDSLGVITSQEMAKMTDITLREKLPGIHVVARALPSDKSRLVRVAQDAGLVVGMTGDGINDAPALKKADVGFAMGTGTEVAKEAGDIVILNNNISSIGKAILYGRTIFKSIRKFIVYQLTMNLCAVGVSIIGPFIGIDTPVTVIQMLWLNMIMDTFAGLAFAGEAPLAEYMNEPPKRRDEPILNRYMINQVAVMGTYTVVLCTLFLKLDWTRNLFGFAADPIYFLTAFFALFIFCGIFNSFSTRTNRLNLFSHLRGNPSFIGIMLMVTTVQLGIVYFGGSLFRTAGLPFRELLLVLALAFSVVPVDFLRKSYLKSRNLPRSF